MSELFQGHTFDEYKKHLAAVREGNPAVANASIRLQDDDDYIEEVLNDTSLSAREFVEVIALCRRIGYIRSIGGANRAAESETDTLYARNHWKFVEEFLQNADDCDYDDVPEIGITVDERDENRPIVEFVYNEKGFTREDVWAITAFSDSTKIGDTVKHQVADGVFYREKTGRKGKGFKSVFAIQADNVIVHIRSNGFSFRLDNAIGRILPIWEDDPNGTDGKTHVTVELVNPDFDVREIYPELRRMFCADEPEGLFARNPLLFMHRLRTVHVTRITGSGSAGFLAAYDDHVEEALYRDHIELNPSKEVLAGIASEGLYYREQLQFGTFSIMSDDGVDEIPDIPAVRYTRMVEDERAYRNYSVFAPLLTSDEKRNWTAGSLFRTFTLAMHPIGMPFAIDAPFVLYADRSRIQYNPHRSDEEADDVPANMRNTAIVNELFGEEGVLPSFLEWLRSYDNIRMDRYIDPKAEKLFADQNNSDEHGGNWVPVTSISSCVCGVPIFRLMSNPEGFVSRDDAMMVTRDLFEWPEPEMLLSLLLGEDYGRRVVSAIYAESSIFSSGSVVRKGFTDSLNRYLDAIEDVLDSTEFITFFDAHLYPFLASNRRIISHKERLAFDNLCIYLSSVQFLDGVHILREPHLPQVRWVHSDVVPAPRSICGYRVFESSPANLEIIGDIASEILGSDTVEDVFGDEGFASTSGSCKSWEDAKNLIVGMRHFGYQTEGCWLPVLEHYALSERLDSDFNAFREANIVETIDDDEVNSFANAIGIDLTSAIAMLKDMGIKKGDDYFRSAGNYLELWPDTIRLLHSEGCTPAMLDHFEATRLRLGSGINATFNNLRNCPDDVLAFLLDESKGLFSTDSYSRICESVQESQQYWDKDDIVARIILIRALAGASRRVSNKGKRSLSIAMDNVIYNNLQGCVERIITESRVERLAIPNNGVFDPIPQMEIEPLIKLFGAKSKRSDGNYFAGNLRAKGFTRLFLRDRSNATSNIYLSCEAPGDYKHALSRFLRQPFDRTKLKQYEEMERQYHDVAETKIIPMLSRTQHDLNRTYGELERRFGTYSKRDVIGILSWFRNSGYSNALGNGSINNEREIEDDYRSDPWKFIYEFIQNVDDCSFGESKPTLTITIDRRRPCIAFDYNELGFSLDDIKALTKFGDSNKGDTLDAYDTAEGVFDREQTGRKGRGFKSVFALPGDDIIVHVRSNGYSFKFATCLGSIIPIWEEDESVPDIGTRIVVEGFDEAYVDGLLDKTDELLGIKDLPSFFSNCPILYLRKLRSITVVDGDQSHSVDIEPVSRNFGGGEFTARGDVISGIAHAGRLQANLWETMRITISTDETSISFNAARFSRMLTTLGMARVASVTSPIVTEDVSSEFTSGCLYRTLPLEEHILPVPIAINAPFITNSGRSAIADERRNQAIVKFTFDELLRGYFEELRDVDEIQIESYIPSGNGSRLFDKYKQVCQVNLQTKIKSFEILRTYSGDSFVSFANAKVLPDECYDWYDPGRLYMCFNEGWQSLVQRRYAGISSLRFHPGQWRGNFVDHINEYLGSIDIDGEELLRLLSDKVYAYLDANYEDIAAEYRKNNRADDLKHMKVFAFEMADGSVILEDGAADVIWVRDTKDDLRSFGRYRCLTGSSLEGTAETHRWMADHHEVVEFRSAFTTDRLGAGKAKSWAEARSVLETVLYFEPKSNPKVPFLADCTLSEELDGERNIFRDAYLATNNDGILQHVIDKDELESIANSSYAWDLPSEEIVGRIRRMGLRGPRDFFDAENGVARLNSHAIALIREYCEDDQTTEMTLSAVSDAYNAMRSDSKKPGQLIVTYQDVSECSDIAICGILRSGLLSGETLSAFANDYCTKRLPRKGVDYAEAYLRALSFTDKVPAARRISITLSDIVNRVLGATVRECMLKSGDSVRLDIVADLPMVDYPSSEIDKALRWLDDENTPDSPYEYYQADIAQAFDQGKASEHFIFDDTKVLLDTPNSEDCMHEFVRRRYRDDDALFGALVDIIHKQNELRRSWSGTKRQFVLELEKFRRDTLKQRELLVPGYDDHLNEATDNALDYVIPELLQNINDCAAAPGQETRTLYVAIDEEAGTMLLEYDEAGFDFPNVYSITAFGQSSKHDEREGEKGLGFKKVFTAFEKVEIYSNGFCFSITSRENTIPVWIRDSSRRERYSKEGKTTMLFTAAASQKRHLLTLAGQWADLVEGNYSDKKISPFFLRNIDSIHLEGNENRYSRNELEKQFVFKRVRLLECYGMLHGNGSDDASSAKMRSITGKLLTRKKCRGMSEAEATRYLENLSVEVAIPRRGRVGGDIGAFYSTLPTEVPTSSEVCLDIPLELTTGRNGIVESSTYNEAILSMVFGGGVDGRSMLVYLLEEITSERSDVNIIDAFSSGIDRFSQSVSAISNVEGQTIISGLAHARILRARRGPALVSLVESYGVDAIIHKYLSNVGKEAGDVERWMVLHSPKARVRTLVIPTTVRAHTALELFAKTVGQDEFFPLHEDGRDLAIEYLADEYGRIAGGE